MLYGEPSESGVRREYTGMTEAELIKYLSERFYSDFADTVARRVRDAGAVGLV